jgi:hypothetical protein
MKEDPSWERVINSMDYRLLILSHGKKVLDEETWNEAGRLDEGRKARLGSKA